VRDEAALFPAWFLRKRASPEKRDEQTFTPSA
jgi:hypothetical protein